MIEFNVDADPDCIEKYDGHGYALEHGMTRKPCQKSFLLEDIGRRFAKFCGCFVAHILFGDIGIELSKHAVVQGVSRILFGLLLLVTGQMCDVRQP